MRRWISLSVTLLIFIMAISSCVKPKATAQPTSVENTPLPTSQALQTASESNDLIDAALQNGKIDAETALTYKVYAQFSDARLPAEFKGAANLSTDSHILDEVKAKYDTLSPQTQAILLPFLMPPVYQGAWGPPAEGASTTVKMLTLPCTKIQTDKWDSTTAMHSPVRFWWQKDHPEDAEAANRLMTAMDDEIWPKLTTLMGRTPLPDSDMQCNGGDANFDVYITPQIARSYAASYFPPGCRETPAYIVLNPGVSDGILAHEFMHAIQWSYNTSADCMYPGEYAWLAEATATWSQNYVYPDTNEEHDYVPWFYQNKGNSVPPSLTLRNDQHEYGAYLFFFYLTNHFGDPGIVKTAWDNTTSMKSVQAVDKAIPGGLDSIWGDFALYNLVEPPIDDYQIWDQLNIKPGSVSLTMDRADPNKIYSFAPQYNRLSLDYSWFTFTDDDRFIIFYNGLTYDITDQPMNAYIGTLPINDGTRIYKFDQRNKNDINGIKVQAYFKLAGDANWQLEDWTDKPYVAFCRDAQAERISDLVIVISNSNQDSDISYAGTYEPRLQTSNIGCWRYRGTASLTFNGQGEVGKFTDAQNLPIVAFERANTHSDITYPYLHFTIAEGQDNRTYNYTGDDCTGQGQASGALTPGSTNNYGNDLYILYGALSGPSFKRYSGQASTSQMLNVTFNCPEGTRTIPNNTYPWFAVDLLSQVLNDGKGKVYTVEKDGSLKGSDDLIQDAENATMQYIWNLQPVIESAASSGGDSGSSSSGSGEDNSSPPGSSGDTPQAPASSIYPDVPDYPNTESSNVVSGSGMIILVTTDSQEDVTKFYHDQLTAAGWMEYINPGGSSDEMVMINYYKDTKVITLMIGESDGKTQIMYYEAGQ